MPTLGERLVAAVEQAEIDSALFKIFTQGGINQDVVTEGGTYPSLAKFIDKTFNWRGDYAGSGTEYVTGETFANGEAIYKVTSSFTSTNFVGDAANYETFIDFGTAIGLAESARDDAQAARDAAQNAQAAAEAVFDSFDDRYLGTFASDPTLDNDGNALTDGAIYWNTTTNSLHFYDLGNTVWVDPLADATAQAQAASDSADAAAAIVPDLQAADNRRAHAGGMAFDGVSGRLSFPPFTFSNGRSIHIKFNPNYGLYNRFFSGTITSSNWLGLFRNGINTLFVRNSAGTLFSGDVDTADLAGRDFNLTVSFVGGDLVFCVDGVLFDTIAVGSSSEFVLSRFSAQPDSSEYLKNILYSLAFFNRALSATEAAELSEIGIEAWLAKYPHEMWAYQDAHTLLTTTYSVFSGTGTISSNTPTGFTVDAGASGLVAHTATSQFPNLAVSPNTSQSMRLRLTISGLDSSLTISFREQGTLAFSATPSTFELGNGTHEIVITIGSNFGWIRFAGINSTAGGAVSIDSIDYLGVLAAYPMTEGNGRQLRDLSGRYDALLSATGYQHLKPKNEGYVRVKGADANPSIMMLADSDIIPEDAVWTQIIAEERIVEIANTAQDLAYRRIRLEDSAGDLLIRRSDGTTHATLGTVTAPTDTDDVDVEVHYKQVIR